MKVVFLTEHVRERQLLFPCSWNMLFPLMQSVLDVSVPPPPRSSSFDLVFTNKERFDGISRYRSPVAGRLIGSQRG